MKETSPYIIYHIPLETALQNNEVAFGEGNYYYCVFWWHSIPLGDLYIDKCGTNIDEQYEAILKAIEKAIDFYISKQNKDVSYKQAFLDKDYFRFSRIMNEIFSSYLQNNLPVEFNVSAVICTRQRSKDLKLCLESLKKQICIPGEIIVVDNAPLDDSTRDVVAQYDNVTYCREIRPGLDIARNTGAKKAKFEIVAYIDDDVQLHPLWSFRVWQTFCMRGVDAMTGLIIATNLETESQQIFEKFWGFNKGYVDIKFDSEFIKGVNSKPQVWRIGAGANMAFRKSVLEKVNYFDERLDVGAAGCSGDSEIWYRILAAGYTIHYNPRAVVFHQHRKNMTDLHKQLFSYMRGHAVAALIQHSQNKAAGYRTYVYRDIPKYYFSLIKTGFPSYPFRYRTLWTEIKGIISGLKFYHRNKNIPPIS